MSMSRIGSIAPSARIAKTENERSWLASTVARYSRKRREQLGLTVERAAELSGLKLSQWLALEDSWCRTNCR